MNSFSKNNKYKRKIAKKFIISIIIVSYNSERILHTCLTSLKTALKHISSEIFIVDNNSKDNSVAFVRTSFPTVRLIVNKKNIGFGAACNQALQYVRGDYILFINPDVFVQPMTLTLLLEYLHKHKEIGILAPQLRFPNGKIQYSCRRYPAPLAHFSKMMGFRTTYSNDYLMCDMDRTAIQEIDWSLGAFLFVRKKVLQEIGGFDERFFLYFEDIDLCRRAKRAGWKVVYYPKAVATHIYQQSSHSLFSKPFFHHLISMYKYYRKYGMKP